MRIIRTWPAEIPEGRNYVVDTLERLVLRDYDQRPLATIDDDILLIEWDLAVSREDLVVFAERAMATPDQVLVAPYKIYPRAYHREFEPVWGHRLYSGTPEHGTMRFVDVGDPYCHLFGLGMTYLPQEILRAFCTAWGGDFSDASLSGWHYRHVRQEVPIAWEVRPVHLHYELAPITKRYRDQGAWRDRGARQRVEAIAQQAAAKQVAAAPADPIIRSLLTERAGYLRTGRKERAIQVDAELARLGYQFPRPH